MLGLRGRRAEDEAQTVAGVVGWCEAKLIGGAPNGQFTVLTPSFEDWTEYLSTVAILILFFGFLLANAGNFG